MYLVVVRTQPRLFVGTWKAYVPAAALVRGSVTTEVPPGPPEAGPVRTADVVQIFQRARFILPMAHRADLPRPRRRLPKGLVAAAWTRILDGTRWNGAPVEHLLRHRGHDGRRSGAREFADVSRAEPIRRDRPSHERQLTGAARLGTPLVRAATTRASSAAGCTRDEESRDEPGDENARGDQGSDVEHRSGAHHGVPGRKRAKDSPSDHEADCDASESGKKEREDGVHGARRRAARGHDISIAPGRSMGKTFACASIRFYAEP